MYVIALFQSIADDVVAGTTAKQAGLNIGAADRIRFKKWMELRLGAEEDAMLETPSKALSEGEQKQLKADLNLWPNSHGSHSRYTAAGLPHRREPPGRATCSPPQPAGSRQSIKRAT